MTLEIKDVLRAAGPVIELAIGEDIGPGDATGEILPAGQRLRGHVTAKAAGVLAGLPVMEAVFHRIDPEIEFIPLAADGQEVVPGEIVAEVRGPGRSLLAAERTALNFLQRMSGIATLTRQYVDAVADTRATILDTRKTAPGFRVLDKYAVRMGGGRNHRAGLYDMILIKDNHIAAAGGISPAIRAARALHPELPIEVEVKSLQELQEALRADPPLDRIMLDNMEPETMRQAVRITGGKVELEASGGVTLQSVSAIAATGVDCISVGALTHSVRGLDISLEVVGEAGQQLPGMDEGARARALKQILGGKAVILGHHYQRDEVIALADFRGDSYQLARDATRTDADFIVFCGVHFMAETAAILARPGQRVVMPDPSAGCCLADMATLGNVEEAWSHLDSALGGVESQVTPITYINSTAELKAFCGRHGGIVCTSSSAERAIRWALARRPRVFFFPDQHLGRNTARRLGFGPEEMLLWDRRRSPTATAVREARIVLWPGACNVHQRFLPESVSVVRERFPGIRVLVHPECRSDVVELADDAGSTSYIIQQVAAAPPGTSWAIGTESHLVQRLQAEHPDQTVLSLAGVPPFCRTMAQTTLENLTEVLTALAEGRVIHEVRVEADTAEWARVALDRMLSV